MLPAVLLLALVTPASDPFLARTRAIANAYVESLPNFICQQVTTRYQTLPPSPRWRAVDRVTAELVYDKGQEQYRNIKLNGRSTSKSMLELPGSRSTGEFASTLTSLFAPLSKTEFTLLGDKDGVRTYELNVLPENSDWMTSIGSRSIVPGYKGRVSIDLATARVLRIEIEATGIPADYPLTRLASTVVYGPVKLGDETYLLPVGAENLSCQGRMCSRNLTEFHDYHKYTGEATITFDK